MPVLPRHLHRRSHGRRQRGAVAIIVGITLAVLIGFVGLALDLGKLYVAKTELQNAADACALAAARELTATNANQLDIAEAAGITTGTRGAVLFQSEAVQLDVDQDVTFSATLNGLYQTKANFTTAPQIAALRYARCTATRGDIANWFIQVLNVIPGNNIGNQTVVSTAAATLAPAQTTCAIPVSICSAALKDATGANKPVGTWLEGAIGPGAAGLTGNFKWIDFTPPSGGASEIAAILKGAGTCNIPSVGTEVGQSGVISSVADEWNSRFGVYKGSTKLEEVTPDFTGYSYTEINWPSKFGAYNDFATRRGSNASLQADSVTGLNIQGTVMTSTLLQTRGADRRLNIVPVVDCDDFVSGTTAPVEQWACVLMLHPINNSAGGGSGGGGSGGGGKNKGDAGGSSGGSSGASTGTGSSRMFLEYRGASNDPASPCASLGLPGTGTVGPLVPVLVQ